MGRRETPRTVGASFKPSHEERKSSYLVRQPIRQRHHKAYAQVLESREVDLGPRAGCSDRKSDAQHRQNSRHGGGGRSSAARSCTLAACRKTHPFRQGAIFSPHLDKAAKTTPRLAALRLRIGNIAVRWVEDGLAALLAAVPAAPPITGRSLGHAQEIA